MSYEIIKLQRPRVNKCEDCDRFGECYGYPEMKRLCENENQGDIYYKRIEKMATSKELIDWNYVETDVQV